MGLTRLSFLESSVGASVGIAASRLVQAVAVPASLAGADPASTGDKHIVPAPTGEWVATTHASGYRAYYSKPAKTLDVTTWVQLDLGESRKIDFIKLYPASDRSRNGE